MSLIAKEPESNFELAPEGTHVARCVQLIDLGTQYSEYWKKSSHKLLIGWELPTELQENGEPFLVWNRYTLSLAPKSALRHDLEAWRSKAFTEDELSGFDLADVVGAPCLVTVNHRKDGDKTYANVTGVAAVLKGVEVPAMVHDTKEFYIENWDDEVFAAFSDKLKETILQSAEARARNGQLDETAEEPESSEDFPDDNIPF